MKKLLLLFITFLLTGCTAEVEMSCKSLREIETYQKISRNKIRAMNEEHSSEMMQSALINANYALELIHKELIQFQCAE
jgi:outer membrane biogenesis lipoprotein LolB